MEIVVDVPPSLLEKTKMLQLIQILQNYKYLQNYFLLKNSAIIFFHLAGLFEILKHLDGLYLVHLEASHINTYNLVSDQYEKIKTFRVFKYNVRLH